MTANKSGTSTYLRHHNNENDNDESALTAQNKPRTTPAFEAHKFTNAMN